MGYMLAFGGFLVGLFTGGMAMFLILFWLEARNAADEKKE